jgi:hypothetical protein
MVVLIPNMHMNTEQEMSGEILPPNPIRVETALSRFPIHRLAKHGDISIDIREKNERGEVAVKWEVNYVGKFGPPGPLAYKVDTLLINRRIEEAARPIPRIIKLGSMSEMCRELGQADSGKNTNNLKNALRQNASAFISARIKYRSADGRERELEGEFNRYSVILTGEKLPDGKKADAVYVVLNDVYMLVINGAMTRPLDYDYLKSLPPAPQRFYELISFQMYAAIKNDRPRAKLLYSELCKYAPLVRQTDWNIARPQLARIHAPHRESGYIAKIDFQDTVDPDGQPDWIMLYQPGPKAKAEYRAFAKRGGPVMLETEPFTADPLPQIAASQPTPLEAELIGHGITDAIARQLVADHAEDKIRQQIEILEWRLAGKKAAKIDDPAAWLVSAIKTGHAAPKGFISKDERLRREEAKKAKEREAAEERRRKQKEEERRREEDKEVAKYRKELTPEQLAQHQAEAIAQADDGWRQTYETPSNPPSFRQTMLKMLTDDHIRHILRNRKTMPAEG